MEMPQHDNQDPEQKIPETPHSSPSARPRSTRKRRLIQRYGLPAIAMLLLVAIVTFVAISVASSMKHVNVQEKPISDILNLADQHRLKSVTINNNDIQAIGTNGQHYHAVKEDGQSVTE